jgi:hypothetical protein
MELYAIVPLAAVLLSAFALALVMALVPVRAP